MPQFFFIHSQRRQGTHFLGTQLGTHTHVHMHREVIKELITPMPHTYGSPDTHAFMQYRAAEPTQWMRAYREYPHPAQVVGMLVHSHNFLPLSDYESRKQKILDALCEYDWQIVDIARKNLLAVYVSDAFAHRTDTWAWWPHKGGPTTGSIQFNAQDFTEYANDVMQQKQQARELLAHYPTHRLWYEDLCANTAQEAVKVQEFLGLDIQPLQPGTKKQERRELSQCVTNWPEVVEQLTGTRWEGCLHGEPEPWGV